MDEPEVNARLDADSWVEAVSVEELQKKRKLTIDSTDGGILLLWHDDRPHALANICIHKDRELVKGTLLNDRIVCPGHQWAFDLETGYCRERERTQPVFETRIEDGIVHVRRGGVDSA